MSLTEDICWTSGWELVERIKKKEISPVEILQSYLERINKVNPLINAIVTVVEDQARTQAKRAEEAVMQGSSLGPLHGIPVIIKDNIFTKGIRTTFGSKLYENFIPNDDAILVQRLKKAGAIILGKTNMPEFGLLPITDNLVFGSTQNPWDIKKTSGGSSGGSAAAVAAGLSALSIGNDVGGSIRIPASLCGVYGIKPSFGRVPNYPRLPGWETLFHEGPITRTVADAAMILEVIAGQDEHDRFTLPPAPNDYLSSLNKGIKGFKVAYPSYRPMFDNISKIASTDLVRAQFDREHILWEKMKKIFDKYDLLLTPTNSVAAFDSGAGGPIGPQQIDNKQVPELAWATLTDHANFTGQPAASVPCGFTEKGLPVGLQIIGRRYSDHIVLQASAAFESARPWSTYRPKI